MSAERIAESTFPTSHLLRRRAEQKDMVRKYENFIATLEDALAVRTGHGLSGYHDYSCICGWYPHGGDASDKQAAVRAHVEREWAAAGGDGDA